MTPRTGRFTLNVASAKHWVRREERSGRAVQLALAAARLAADPAVVDLGRGGGGGGDRGGAMFGGAPPTIVIIRRCSVERCETFFNKRQRFKSSRES